MESKAAPAIDLIESWAESVVIADLHCLDGVAFFPGLFVECPVILDPGASGVGEKQIGEDLVV